MRQKNRHDEDLLCMAFNEHCLQYFPRRKGSLIWTHIANQGRSQAQGDKLKKMGVYAGFFDFIFLAHPNPFQAICLEAKVHGRDYSKTQERFDYLTENMPIYKGKFYSVKEGHNLLIEAGLNPLRPCSLFKEPDYLTKEEKFKLAIDMFKRISDEKNS